jgi:hypothetical protein
MKGTPIGENQYSSFEDVAVLDSQVPLVMYSSRLILSVNTWAMVGR